jgi:hypothetical protein
MSANQLTSMVPNLHPFAIIPWEIVPQFVSITPLGYGSGMNTPVEWNLVFKDDQFPRGALIATASNHHPDTSRLALVACGDIEAAEPLLLSLDNELDFSASGYREFFLTKCLKPEYGPDDISAHLDDEVDIVPPPDRIQLDSIIEDKYKFPLSNCTAILDACFQLEDLQMRPSFIGLTATYKRSGQVLKFDNVARRHSPALVILVSDAFELDEALLFWNLRASDSYVAWLPFYELESSIDDLARWLDSDYRGAYYGMTKGLRSGITFSSSGDNLGRLQEITIRNEISAQQAARYQKRSS